jgi:uroporphyrinogen-III synthase
MSTTSPLAGRTIVVTRPREQAAALAKAIAAEGGQPLLFPLLEILPVADPRVLETGVTALPGAALAIFISPNAVDHALPAILAHGPWPAGTVPAAVGQGTVKALAACGVAGCVAPRARFDSEALLARRRRSRTAG